MKILLLFLSLMMIFLSFLTFRADLDRAWQDQTWIKNIAEDCAAGAALYYQEESLGEGSLLFDEVQAMAHLSHLVADQQGKLSVLQDGQLQSRVSFFDDDQICTVYVNGSENSSVPFSYPYRYRDEQGHEILIQGPSVVVTLTLPAGDRFRLPFLSEQPVIRSTMYELVTGSGGTFQKL